MTSQLHTIVMRSKCYTRSDEFSAGPSLKFIAMTAALSISSRVSVHPGHKTECNVQHFFPRSINLPAARFWKCQASRQGSAWHTVGAHSKFMEEMGPKKDPGKSKSLGKMVFITSLGSRPLRPGGVTSSFAGRMRD